MPEDDQPPDPDGWLSTDDAAEVLGVGGSHVGYLIRTGRLDGVRRGRRLWVREDDVTALAGERAGWVSYAGAAAMVGCSSATVTRAVQLGLIRGRRVDRSLPSLAVESVQAWAADREREQAAAEEARSARRARVHGPPDDGEV